MASNRYPGFFLITGFLKNHFMDTSYEYWIETQNDPGLIVRGNYKRHKPKPAWAEKNDLMDKMRKELGDEKYFANIREDQEAIERSKENNLK